MSAYQIILMVIAVALPLGRRVAPKIAEWMSTDPSSSEELMVVEVRALNTLKRRAERRKCDKMKAAVEQVEECFMGGDDPL